MKIMAISEAGEPMLLSMRQLQNLLGGREMDAPDCNCFGEPVPDNWAERLVTLRTKNNQEMPIAVAEKNST